MTAIPIRIATTILDEIENVYDDITKKAYEKFLDRGGCRTLDIEDWLAAEKQLLWKPEVKLTEKREAFVVRVALAGMDPADVNILVTPDDVVVQSRDPRYPRLFRALHFPHPIDPAQVRGTYVKGTLILIALKMAVSGAFAAVPARAATRAGRTVHR